MTKPYYARENVTLWHGDCRELLGAGVVSTAGLDAVVTDPPYGIKSVKKDSGLMAGVWRNSVAKKRIYKPVQGDDKDIDLDWLRTLAPRVIVWGAEHFKSGIPPSGRLLIWDKRGGMASNNFADAEVAWDSHDGATRLISHRQAGMLNAGYGDVERFHPNQKPLTVERWRLLVCKKIASLIDPYAGSGTTLVAAAERQMTAIGIEYEEPYCEAIAKRLDLFFDKTI